MSDNTGSPDQRKNLSSAKQALLEQRLQAALQSTAELPTIPHRTRQGFAPLSYGQEGLWFISQLDSSTPVYNRPVALRLNGALDHAALKRALEEILRRHEVLRSRYRNDLGQPLQEIIPSIVLDLPQVDLSNVSSKEREEKTRLFVNQQARIPLNLARSPLLRPSLFRFSESEHILLLVFHHITFDAWSERVLLKELSVLYGAFSKGAASPLPEPVLQYADYAVWQRERMETGEFHSHLAYWKNKLGELPPALELPADYPRPTLYSNRGAKYPLNLPTALVAALKDLGLRQNATLSMVFLAAYLTLLYRYTGQPDVLIGMPVAGRTLVEMESLIGLFINTLALRCNLAGEPTFLELLERTHQVVLEALDHQEVPLEELVAELNPPRDPSRTPFFQVLFNYKNIPGRSVQFPGLETTTYNLDLEVAPFDLTLELVPQGEDIGCTFFYNSDLYHPLTIERLARNFLQLLQSALVSPELPITRLPILSEVERRQTLVEWNRAEQEYPNDVCIHHIFEDQVKQSPNAIALVFRNQSLTYAELNARSNQLAHYLRQSGVGPHSLVGICMERSLEMIVGLLGILKAGGGYLPLDPHLPAERLIWIIRNSQAAIVLTDSQLAENLDLCDVRKVLIDSTWQEIARHSPHNCSSNVTSENLAYTIYTSGSTGMPKGICIPHRALCNHVRWARQAFDLFSGHVALQMANLNFDISVSEIFDTLTSGGRLVLAEPREYWDVITLIDLIIQHQITHLQVVPSVLRMIVENGRFADCITLQHVLCGGEILPADLALQFVTRSIALLHNLYGPSETCIDSTHMIIPGADPGFKGDPSIWRNRPISIGRPIANVKIYILDPYLEPVPIGVSGELYIAGVSLGLGYLNDPLRTAESFIPNPFGASGERLYRTGDLVSYAWDGSLRFLGRIDEQVKLRGYRIELGEIENVLVGHPLVHQAIAGIHRDVSSSQASERDSLVVYIVPEQASSPTIQELRQYLRGKLPGYMLPSEFIFLEAMPLLPNGKVDRRALAALKPSQLLENEYIAPRTPFEQVLAEIWSEIFEVEQVGLQDNFFELGGHSLLAMRLYSRIEAAFGLDVPIGLLYDSPSLGVFSTSLALLAGDPASLNSIAPLLLQSAGPNEDEARKIQMEATSAQTEKLAGNPRQTEQETVLELVTRLRKQNIRIWTANDELKYSAPPGRMTLDLRAELSTRKLEIISFLQQQQENGRISKMVSPDKIPLSFAQQRLFFIQQFEPASYVYNLVETFRILGELDLKALEGGINEVVRRHSSLRTLFQVQDSQPVQIVQPSRQIPLRITDLRYLPEKGRLGKAVALLESDCCHPFDLSHDTLIRPMLIQLSEKECLFQITMHHIITDGWSMDIFFRELSQLYNAKQSGKTANLKDIQVQYTDFTLKQREHLSGAVLESLVDYWKKQLATAPVLLSLPADRPRPTVQSFKGARLNFSFPHELTGRLRSLSLEHNVTMFMLLLAAFKVLIYRYTGQEDVLVGVPIANRTSSEIENLIGFFVNTLLLRTNLSGSPSFKEILRRVRRVSLEAYQYQDLPFEKLVEVINPPRIRSHSPLFQVSLAFQTAPSARLNFTGLDVEPFNIARGISHFDWTLFLIDRAGELSGAWEYNSDIFDRTTIERALGHFLALLDDAADHPLKPIGRLQMLTRAESRQITQGWNNTQVKYAKSACLHQVFQDQVKRNPGALAMTSIDAGLPGSSGQESLEMQSITYSELNARANRLAHHLRRLGVGRGTLVGLCVQRSIELVVGILGILKAGGAYVPLDPDTPVGRMEYILQETRSTLLLTQASLSGQLPGMQITTVYLDSDQGVIGACSSDDLPVDVFPDDPAYVIFTSGSTGKPKGVSISHYNVLRLFQATHHWFNFDEKDVWTLFHSFAFDFSVWEFWGALLYGGRLVVVPFWTSRTPDAFAQLISEQGVTVLNQTPSAFLPLLQITRFLDPQIISSLRLVIFGGEALNIQSLRPWFDRRGAGQVELVNMYGITETTVHVTYRPITQNDLDGSGSVIGVPIPDLQTYLLDQDMQPVPVGVPGEIYVGGAGLSQGYLNRPELTAERFVPNPFNNQSGERLYRSGDLARYLPNGDLEYLGRRDHQVKIRGFRIELGEIEALLSEYPGVQQVVVLLRQDHEEQSGIKSSQLVAYLVAETELSASDLRHYLKTRLPEYMLPAAFVFMPDFPLTSNGKVDRDALPKPASLATSKEQEYLAPRTAFEQVLSRLWAEVLGIEQVGLKDNFFQLGGHSLLAMRLIYRFEELFNMRLEINMLFDIPVVEDFANFILENSANREYLEKVAELLIELTDLSEEEARLILIRKQQEKGGSEKSER